MSQKWEEQIVVAPTKSLFGENKEHYFQGLLLNSSASSKITDNIIKTYLSESTLMRRGSLNDPTLPEKNAEINPSFKQLIPYGVLVSDDRDGNLRVFAYERLKEGGEARLHGQISIGVGGHMNELFTEDKTFIHTVMTDAKRELTEELNFESVEGEVDVETYGITILGFINDDENEVGRVHLGVLYAVETNPNHSVTVKETDQLKGEWMTIDELLANEGRLEPWSKIALTAIQELHVEA